MLFVIIFLQEPVKAIPLMLNHLIYLIVHFQNYPIS